MKSCFSDGLRDTFGLQILFSSSFRLGLAWQTSGCTFRRTARGLFPCHVSLCDSPSSHALWCHTSAGLVSYSLEDWTCLPWVDGYVAVREPSPPERVAAAEGMRHIADLGALQAGPITDWRVAVLKAGFSGCSSKAQERISFLVSTMSLVAFSVVSCFVAVIWSCWPSHQTAVLTAPG